MSDLVALSFDLMTTHNEVQLVLFQEALRHIWPKLTTHSPLADGPAILHDHKRERERGVNKLNLNSKEKWTTQTQ